MQSVENLEVLGQLQQSLMDVAAEKGADHYPIVQANFYPAYHGHNRCDAHFGRIKQNVRNALTEGAPKRVLTVMSSAEAIPHTTALHIPPFVPEKLKRSLRSRPLKPGDPEPRSAYVASTDYKCVLFDPGNPHTLLLYPYSDRPLSELPLRCAIKEDGAGLDPIRAPLDEASSPWNLAMTLQNRPSMVQNE